MVAVRRRYRISGGDSRDHRPPEKGRGISALRPPVTSMASVSAILGRMTRGSSSPLRGLNRQEAVLFPRRKIRRQEGVIGSIFSASARRCADSSRHRPTFRDGFGWIGSTFDPDAQYTRLVDFPTGRVRWAFDGMMDAFRVCQPESTRKSASGNGIDSPRIGHPSFIGRPGVGHSGHGLASSSYSRNEPRYSRFPCRAMSVVESLQGHVAVNLSLLEPGRARAGSRPTSCPT